jgi:hypothetical protein
MKDEFMKQVMIGVLIVFGIATALTSVLYAALV